jgi:exopolysaccharide production protein ExoY
MLDESNPCLDPRTDQDRSGEARLESALMMAGNKMAASKLYASKLYRNRAKRLLDIIGALAILFFCLPLMLIIAALVSAADKGPVLFGHQRVGVEGKLFTCWKFRTMIKDHESLFEAMMQNQALRDEWSKNFKMQKDWRITRIGYHLRRSSLDELPQLFNVLAGTMSLVGPRPITENEIANYGPAFDDYKSTRPGITGIWQVSGRSNLSYSQRVKLDSDYVRNWSLLSDLMILLHTPMVVIFRIGAY